VKRREVLISAAGIAVLSAGCSSGGSEPETKGYDDNPIDAEPEKLLFDLDYFGEQWEQDEIEVDGNSAQTGFVNWNNKEEVLINPTVYNTVNEAKSEYQQQHDSNFEDANSGEVTVEEVDIGSEGHFYKIDTVTVLFRDANVIGNLLHTYFDPLNGDISEAQKYAADWHTTWRE